MHIRVDVRSADDVHMATETQKIQIVSRSEPDDLNRTADEVAVD